MTNHPNRSIKSWPDYLRAFRIKHSMTQADMAKALQVSKRSIEEWEGGRTTPSPFLLRALNDIELELGADKGNL